MSMPTTVPAKATELRVLLYVVSTCSVPYIRLRRVFTVMHEISVCA